MTILPLNRHARAIPAPAQPAPPPAAAPPPPAVRVPFAGARIFANGGASALVLPNATRAQRLEVAAWLMAAKDGEGRADG